MTNNNEIKVSVHFNDSDVNVVEILKQSLWLYIMQEVKKICESC